MSSIPGRGGCWICPRPWPQCCVSSLAVERVAWVFVNRTADRFIEAFEKLYGRKPKAEGADGDFKIQVAQGHADERRRPTLLHSAWQTEFTCFLLHLLCFVNWLLNLGCLGMRFPATSVARRKG